jgi:hypothetical protein
MHTVKHEIKQEEDPHVEPGAKRVKVEITQAVKREIKHEDPHGAKRVKVEITQGDSLDPKQREILNLCLGGRNIFLTGVGGVWSSFRTV